ncbi:peptide/nickel transport system substrate-binding protein [Variovorax sp. CF079]|uniref:ABC transporter substrate-binding protein n=1 Tax=Variovorax sp. CF079 TaxID=1882774 RepID=UPI0008880208|nr:ABC transporter substrate-binding protein [Variovorax sp. CF079]SDE40769.1 peptide/nickel transport system substrate-binding protein [Variovorax sp. CF079]
MRWRQGGLRGLLCAALFAFGAGLAHGQELRIGLSSNPSTVDPHFYNNDAVSAVVNHAYETLVALDPDTRLIPALAASWRTLDDTTWEFKLRDGVKFHDGSALTAEDVIFSLDRPATITNSPSSFTTYTRSITGKKAIDRLTVQLTTATPSPLLPNDLTRIFIVSRKLAEKASTDDFNQVRLDAGTGPFRIVKFTPGSSVQFARFDDYWGAKAAWSSLTLRMLPADSARMSALLSGDVQLVENVQANLVPQFRQNKELAVFDKVSSRVMFLYTDHRDSSPFVTDKEGKPLQKNPLKDARVRQAISKLIDRNVLAERVLDKLGVPTANVAAPGMFGFNPALKPEAVDVAGARKLLAEAGYPEGFGLTIFGPNDRYINDEQVVQTIGQMLTRGGIATKVQVSPMSTYIGRASKKELGFGLLGWGVGGGEPAGAMRGLLGTADKDKGMGAINWSSYSNPQFDALLTEAMHTVDNKRREQLLQQAAELALKKDYAIIPLYNQVATWAARKGIAFVPRVDEFTLASQVRPD